MSDDVKTVWVGGHGVGIIGLQKIFEDLKAEGIESDERVKDELVARVKKKNHIPPSAENDYAAALVEEYKRFMGMAVDERKHLEVKILGPGCMQCEKLERGVIGVLAEMEMALPARPGRALRAWFPSRGAFSSGTGIRISSECIPTATPKYSNG